MTLWAEALWGKRLRVTIDSCLSQRQQPNCLLFPPCQFLLLPSSCCLLHISYPHIGSSPSQPSTSSNPGQKIPGVALYGEGGGGGGGGGEGGGSRILAARKLDEKSSDQLLRACWSKSHRSRRPHPCTYISSAEPAGNKPVKNTLRDFGTAVVGWRLGPGLLGRSHASLTPRRTHVQLRLEALAKTLTDFLARYG